MTLSALGIFSAAGAGGVVADTSYDLLETQILGSATSSITFSSLGTYSSTYKHLQIRAVTRDTAAAPGLGLWLQFNGVTTNSYAWHRLLGNGSAVSSGSLTTTNKILAGISPGSTQPTGSFGASVFDVLDFSSTTKNTTIRTLSGLTGSGSPEIFLGSGLFNSTAAITSMTISGDTNFLAGSRFSLYGIKG